MTSKIPLVLWGLALIAPGELAASDRPLPPPSVEFKFPQATIPPLPTGELGVVRFGPASSPTRESELFRTGASVAPPAPKEPEAFRYSVNGTPSGELGIFRAGEGKMVPEMVEHHASLTSKLLGCLLGGSLPDFVFPGTDHFKKFEPDRFNALARRWGLPLGTGYGLTYLGEMRKGRFVATVWRIRFFGGGDDALVTLSTDRRGSVEEFNIQ